MWSGTPYISSAIADYSVGAGRGEVPVATAAV